MMKKIFFTLSLLLTFVCLSNAQQIITGKILDKKGNPKKDFSVILGDDKNKATSDKYGRFTMKLDSVYIADSLLQREFIIQRDSLFLHDTIKISKQIEVHDTIRKIDTLTFTKRIELIDTVRRFDTLRMTKTVELLDTIRRTDTLSFSIFVYDTIRAVDTVTTHKKFIIQDTVYETKSFIKKDIHLVYDTLRITDTIYTKIKSSRPSNDDDIDDIVPRKTTATRTAGGRPVIGISDVCHEGQASATRTYVDAVLAAGGLPVIVPYIEDKNTLESMVESLDALILTGGGDIDPAYYNAQRSPKIGTVQHARDPYDFALLRLAEKKNIPVLGVCRGIQVINVAYGGSLYQDLPTEYPVKTISHRNPASKGTATHDVSLSRGSLIAKITGEDVLFVNSLHHQAVKKIAPGFKATGVSDDGVIEVLEPTDQSRRILGVEFHPEALVHKDPAMLKIFKYLISEAKKPR